MTDFVINDENFARFTQADGGIWGGKCGTKPRQTAYGASSVAVQVPLDVIPYEEWPDRIADQTRNKASLEDLWRDSGMGVLMQSYLNYCWAFSSVGALMLERMSMGLPFEMLSPSSVAAPIVGYQNVGYYIEEALKGLMSQGAAPQSFVPMVTTRANDFKPRWREEAAKYKVTQAKDVPANHQVQGSQLLLNRPMPTGINWWGHSVLYVRVLDRYPNKKPEDPNRYGFKFLNSWDVTWGDRGWGVFEGSKQVANQAYVITQASFTE